MCGIAGFWSERLGAPRDLLACMVQRLHHRGPDSSGHWQAEHGGPLLGHARLAIVDLSVHGHQPMHCAEGRYTLCYNGEIYNHLELRQALAPQVWRGHSDTETLLAGITRWGVERTLQQAVGMFAIALWDAQERCLWLARDRLGEKPLYLARCNGGIAFASELKALLPVPGINLDVDPQAVDLYLQLGTVPAPLSIYQGICKLMPGELMRLDAPGAEPSRQRYWQLPLDTTGIDTSEDDAALTEFERLLLQSITGQRLADVPLGTFLSGGVDSSLITALLQQCSDRPVRSFSIGFAGSEHDESAQAAAVARHLGTEHTELQVSADDALALVPRLAGIWDEPFADASQIPTLLLSRLTREHVTVALSGDAGDELFGGYNRHRAAARWWPRMQRLPLGLRRALAAVLKAPSARSWDRAGAALNWLRPHSLPSAMGEKVQKFAALAGATGPEDAYLGSLLHWAQPPLRQGHQGAPALVSLPHMTLPEAMMRWDLLGYLPDDILVKVDRAAMCHSLETRVPLLDHRIVEFALRQPLSRKIRGGQTKWMMRQLLYRRVPRELIERPKQGFSLPLDQWLRGPLRPWAEELLQPNRLEAVADLDPTPIRRCWDEHLRGQRNHAQRLWTVLMLQAWHALPRT